MKKPVREVRNASESLGYEAETVRMSKKLAEPESEEFRLAVD